MSTVEFSSKLVKSLGQVSTLMSLLKLSEKILTVIVKRKRRQEKMVKKMKLRRKTPHQGIMSS